MKIKTHHILLVLVLFFKTLIIEAQILDYNNKVEVVLNNGMNIVLYGKANTLQNNNSGIDGSQKASNEYYYLPTNLRLAKREDGVPKFLFIKYTTDARETAGGTQGALMHFLMEWGLDATQMAELQTKLEAKLQGVTLTGGKPSVKGPVELESGENSFSVISASLSDDKSAKTITSGRAPVFPGGLVAVGSKMDKYTAQLMSTTLEKTKSIADLSLRMDMKFKLLAPSIRGKITFDWSKLEILANTFKDDATVSKKSSWSFNKFLPSYNSKITNLTRNQVEDLKKSLVENKVVKIEIENYQENNAISDKLIEHFTQMFVNSITDKTTESAPATPQNSSANEPPKDNDINHSFSINKSKLESKYTKKIETYDLSLRSTISYPIQLVGNLSDWYSGVKNNPQCVTSVNLSDPFFQHRDIRFILDLEAEQMFGQEVNYVTVSVRKNRSSGQPFNDDITIDRDYLKKTGTQASLTYARNGDNSTDLYEYKTQWSLRGYIIYPENPVWLKGEWQGVTLGAPVTPRTIEFEGDIAQLKEMNIARATLQVRYKKFGQEVESEIPLTVSQNEPLVRKTFLIDRNTQGYAYRMVFTHKTEGKLAFGWNSKINDGYVFASIPEEFKDKGSDIFKKAMEAGKTISAGSESEKKVTKGAEVLDKFKDILKVITSK